MSDLKNIYSQMWIDSIDKFKNNNCELDLFINDPSDMRRGITLLSYLDNSVGDKISSFLDEVKIIEPKQYYYPKSELHLTILSIISCMKGVSLLNIDAEAYSSIFRESIKDIDGFKIKFRGITVSPSCILIQGFPDSDQLNHLRNTLRVNFKKANLKSTIDQRYKLSTAHTTAVRFITPFENSCELMALLAKYRDYDFGTLEVSLLELVFNNWYQNLSITKNLSRASLKSNKTYL